MTLMGFMAKGERGFETPEAAPRPIPASAPTARTVSPPTSVDASTQFDGTLRCKQTLRIDGSLKGEVECDKAVMIGETAKIYASITADEVQIAGFVEGDITARRKITLERTAVVSGDLITPGIVIEEGAKLKGRIVIGSDTESTVDVAVEKKGSAQKKASPVAAKTSETPAAQAIPTSA